MRILALDPAEYRVGYAFGTAGIAPTIGVYKLRAKDERTEEAVGRFAEWLALLICDARDEDAKFDLVVAENYLPHGAMKGMTTSATRDGAILLNGAIRAICGVYGIEVRCPYPATVRKHFCGRARGVDRADTKRMVIVRARQLGYIDRDCADDDMADAAALYDFASSHFATRAASFALT